MSDFPAITSSHTLSAAVMVLLFADEQVHTLFHCFLLISFGFCCFPSVQLNVTLNQPQCQWHMSRHHRLLRKCYCSNKTKHLSFGFCLSVVGLLKVTCGGVVECLKVQFDVEGSLWLLLEKIFNCIYESHLLYSQHNLAFEWQPIEFFLLWRKHLNLSTINRLNSPPIMSWS